MPTSINALEVPVATVSSSSGASYTIPAQRYAIVRVQVSGGGTYSVDGATILRSTSWSVIRSNASPNTYATAGKPLLGTDNGATGVDNGPTFANGTAESSATQTYKVLAGSTVIGSSTAQHHVEVYQVPGATA